MLVVFCIQPVITGLVCAAATVVMSNAENNASVFFMWLIFVYKNELSLTVSIYKICFKCYKIRFMELIKCDVEKHDWYQKEISGQ